MREMVAGWACVAGALGVAVLFGGNVFEAVVSVPNWTRGVDELAAYRAFAKHANPGDFFRVVSPMTNVCLLVSLAAGWGRPRARNGAALVAWCCAVVAEVFTVAYFFPRNAILFEAELGDGALAMRTAGEWGRANLVRIGIEIVALVAVLRCMRIDLRAERNARGAADGSVRAPLVGEGGPS